MKTNQDFKNAALAALKGNWGAAVLATVVFILITLVITGPISTYSVTHQVPASATPAEMASLFTSIGELSTLTILLSFFILIPLEIGFVNAFRKLLVFGDDRLTSNTFNFSNYWRKVGGMILVGLFTFLWSLLLYIPGIIKAFSYSMTKYILDDNPELSASEAIHRSRMMMKGHKFDLFWLYLSFIGWIILCLLTCCIGFIWLVPYMQTAEAAFYEEVKADYALHGGLD